MADEKRLIDADALVTEIQSTASTVCLNAPWNAEWFSRLAYRQEEIVAMIERQPKVDAVEVVHGRWEKVKQDLGDGIKTYRFGCSECGYLKNTLTGNYCPNCGAKMDGDGNRLVR